MRSPAAPDRRTRAERREGSMLCGVSSATPSEGDANTITSSPAGRRMTLPRPAPTTAGADPLQRSPSFVRSAVRPTAPTIVPSASPGRYLLLRPSVPDAAIVALATSVGTNGPGTADRPNCSTTTTNSGNPKPEPPACSGRCSPSQPRLAISPQKVGRDSVSDSRSRRLAPSASFLARKELIVSASAWCSSEIPIGIVLPLLPQTVHSVHYCFERRHWVQPGPRSGAGRAHRGPALRSCEVDHRAHSRVRLTEPDCGVGSGGLLWWWRCT